MEYQYFKDTEGNTINKPRTRYKLEGKQNGSSALPEGAMYLDTALKTFLEIGNVNVLSFTSVFDKVLDEEARKTLARGITLYLTQQRTYHAFVPPLSRSGLGIIIGASDMTSLNAVAKPMSTSIFDIAEEYLKEIAGNEQVLRYFRAVEKRKPVRWSRPRTRHQLEYVLNPWIPLKESNAPEEPSLPADNPEDLEAVAQKELEEQLKRSMQIIEQLRSIVPAEQPSEVH